MNIVCKKGVQFSTLKPQDRIAYPCWDEKAGSVCQHAAYPRGRETAWDTQFGRALVRMTDFMRRKTELCFRCGKQVESLRQEGGTVYGSCGCRLWNGRIPFEWTAAT